MIMILVILASLPLKAVNLEQLNSEEQKAYLDGKYDTTDRVVAPAMAWFLGFGTGQAALGVYGDRGWYFTLADSVGFVMMITGLFSCEANRNCSPPATTALGVGVFVGSRVWQFVDSITYPIEQNKRYEMIKQKLKNPEKAKAKVSYFIAPINQGASLGLRAEF